VEEKKAKVIVEERQERGNKNSAYRQTDTKTIS
jgi:hypothetical protein